MKSITLLLPLILAIGSSASASTLLFQDNFNDPDGSLTTPTAGRVSGLAAGQTALESFRSVQSISNNQLALNGNGGVRFGPENDRYDWAGPTTGGAILAAGGFSVSFDWTYAGSSTDWLAFKIGGPNADSNVNPGDLDFSILLRENGGNQLFDNGANLGDTGLSFAAVPNVTVPVVVNYMFDSFADGSNVNVTASVDGVEVVNNNFTWDGNNGELYFELQAETDFSIDNLAIATIPEPSVASLGLLGGLFLLRRKRRSVA